MLLRHKHYIIFVQVTRESVIISCNRGQANFVHRPSSFFSWLKQIPQLQQILRQGALPDSRNPVRRDPNFIYTDFQRHLASLDDESDFPASLFPESDVSGRKCTKKTTKRPTSKQSHQLLDPDFLYTDLESQLNDLRLSNLEQEASPSSHLQQAQRADILPHQATFQRPIYLHKPPLNANLIMRFAWSSSRKRSSRWSWKFCVCATPPGLPLMARRTKLLLHLRLLIKRRRSALSTGHTSLLQV